jgi:hypothetical protein
LLVVSSRAREAGVDEGTIRSDPSGGAQREDFVAWAMGRRAAARALVFVPIAAGILAALMATELGLSAGLPAEARRLARAAHGDTTPIRSGATAIAGATTTSMFSSTATTPAR